MFKNVRTCDHNLTLAADQYSLAALVYQCLTGTSPLVYPNQVLGPGAWLSMQGIQPHFNSELDALIIKALSLNPHDRFDDIRQLGQKLVESL